MTVTDSGATIKPRVPAYKMEGSYEAPPAAVLNGGGGDPHAEGKSSVAKRIAILGIEESPPERRDASSTALIDAVQKVYAAVTARIAYHERELVKLRESLKPFAAHTPRQIAATDDGASAQAIRAVLDLADQMNLNGEPKS